ncbi:acetoacetate metabolism regulatory protein AtoC [Geobacter sp. OR-1]|uniref:sigma-54-dependent transcriptional regulator n=1 Tax=Geobacter sp. OR-1 TaxID=1266765 RepID=UPI000542BB00|nr:sigma-54 dependent transcriptional regulator [Geobacter sp. OR-1]GAM08655.1 acetoacetate metabolism regulatory protein AtoC [Geobacter sp. OR-1]
MDTILIIDDEFAVLCSFAAFFEDCGFRVLKATNGCDGLDIFRTHRPDIVFTDLRMPGLDGFALLSTVKQESPETPVVVISGIGVIADAIKAVKMGAFDFVSKPVRELPELEIIAKKALETRELRSEVAALRDRILDGRLLHQDAFSAIITKDAGMTRIFQYIEAIAPSSQPILISGQTGTGKELIAGAIHKASDRKGQFVALNLGGLDDQMFSDTLFGHLKGAFTGADRPREGMIVQATNGTLFLDEIGELTETSQVRLLRLLQEQEYFPLGSDTPRKSSARIIAATNRELSAMVKEGRFRQDLYYRLCTHHVQIPPLASRKGDIPFLLENFVADAAAAMDKPNPSIPPELYRYLNTYDFPGNVRELKSMAYDAVARHKHGPLPKDNFISAMGAEQGSELINPDETIALIPASSDRMPTLKEAEEALICKALQLADGNQGVAARYLGITRQGLNKILNRKKTS